ncbi:MAG: hypothetical protein GX811_01360 [Lentisphaerae bacterium]|nr:hypothetical protein [Lentisphaerota bacterium]
MSSKILKISGVITASVLLFSGCAMFRIDVQEKDSANLKHDSAKYDYSDLRNLSEEVVHSIASAKFVADMEGNPIMIIGGIQPRTTTFVDTQALTERIRSDLTRQSKIRFVNESKREQLMKERGYQAAYATPETTSSIGKELGAKYMISGALVEMASRTGKQVRVSKTETVSYQLTVDITDMETGIIQWSDKWEFSRAARTPLIGW